MEVGTLRSRQKELWDNYEQLLGMKEKGIGSKYEVSLLKRLDWWDKAEIAFRLEHPSTGCIHGDDKVCPDRALACCTVCAATGRWRDATRQINMEV